MLRSTPAPSFRLPAGMRDFLPRAAAARRLVVDALLGAFEAGGYARVIPPAFEYESTLAAGRGGAARAAAPIRFVEPGSGEVLALPDDITPQIARIIATHYRDQSGPVRLCYDGAVFRLERGAQRQRQVVQAGVELAGVPGWKGEVEAVALGAAALAAAGLRDVTIDLAHLGLAREVLSALRLPPELQGSFHARIARRDQAALDSLLAEVRAPAAAVRFARMLPGLHGGPEVLRRAAERAPTAGVRAAIAELQALERGLDRCKVAARLHIDLGEIRGFDYYTGVRFQAFAPGAPDAVLRGGRYDGLLGRFGRARPAVGFAVDVEAVAGAMHANSGMVAAGDALELANPAAGNTISQDRGATRRRRKRS